MVGKQGGTIYAQFERLSFFVSGNDPAFITVSMGASKDFADTGYIARLSRLSNGHVLGSFMNEVSNCSDVKYFYVITRK